MIAQNSTEISRKISLVACGIFLRVVQGVGMACAETLAMSFLIYGTQPEKLAAIFASFEITVGLGYQTEKDKLTFRLLAGPPLGSVLYTYLGFSNAYIINGSLLILGIAVLPFLPSGLSKTEDIPDQSTIHLKDVCF
jgi:MFS family permease